MEFKISGQSLRIYVDEEFYDMVTKSRISGNARDWRLMIPIPKKKFKKIVDEIDPSVVRSFEFCSNGSKSISCLSGRGDLLNRVLKTHKEFVSVYKEDCIGEPYGTWYNVIKVDKFSRIAHMAEVEKKVQRYILCLDKMFRDSPNSDICAIRLSSTRTVDDNVDIE
jgi:hypothetical protein